MSYRREIELVFDTALFQERDEQEQQQQDSRIDLWYLADKRELSPLPATPEKDFFLQCIRDHVRGMMMAPSSSAPRVSRLLSTVSASWDKANAVARHVRLLNLSFPTSVAKTSDASIAIRSSVLLVPLQTRAEVVLTLQSVPGVAGEAVEVAVMPDARVVYGEPFNVVKMKDFLDTKLGGCVLGMAGDGKQQSWSDVVSELHRRLLARGLKARQK
ncbi:hypothetical protein B0T24DRAFT_684370 [Lasiosphaeria ovina]|uniref:Knl1 C-terminal RWD domain-containing protein n=1 Tax=Lasiosphaeria ovina TaxID=92902 RepID=A0AAE0JUN6_9PEZI|nr:hypothetical protein B0T24DRAFT_684370 [Lasiosphaeria ovina]